MSAVMAQAARLNAAAQTLLAYAGSDACLALVEWIDAVSAVYKDELVDVSPEALVALQSQVRQLAALRGLLLGTVKTNGRI